MPLTLPFRRTPSRVLFAALIAAPLVSCAISQQQEVSMGASGAAEVGKQLPLIRDAAVVRYIDALGTRIANVTGRSELDWTFTVVDSREVNAFALPGGWVYVNRGLIERATTMQELAGVLAHEIGHVTRRHSVEQMQQLQGANVGVTLLCTLTKVCEGGASQAAINIGGSALFAKYSRDDESEADAEAVATTIRAGISPQGIPAMFRILIAERRRTPGALDAFFASHPLAEDRIRATEALIARRAANELNGLTTDTPEFRAFRQRLRSLPPSPAPR